MTKRLLMMLACALLLLDTGCSFVEGGDGKGHVPDGWCESHRCDAEPLVYTAAGEGIGDLLDEALARYSVATGRELTTDVQAGIPVIWSENLEANGIDDCGMTIAKGFNWADGSSSYWTQVVMLDPTPPRGCPDPEQSLLHELVHALAPASEHAPSGLYAKASEHDWIDDEALDAVCGEFRCEAFSPETGPAR